MPSTPPVPGASPALAVRALPAPSPHGAHFRLDPSIVYLNHGSFGACPTPVLEAQRRCRDRIEADAVRFFVEDLWGLTDLARAALAPIVGADARGLVFVPNATTGVATVLHNLELRPGDEVLVTSHEYTACLNNARAAARRAGAGVVVAELPWPVPDENAVFDAVMARVTARTRVALVSLVTSATGLRLPAERIIAALNDRGIDTILDAAHGPGCVPMRLDAWGAAYATGNCHKWLCAPKGAAFLHIRGDRRAGFRPLVLSNDAERLEAAAARTGRSPLHHQFDYTGTDDPSARLSIPDAAGFMNSVLTGDRDGGGVGGDGGGGLDALMARNRALCIEARALLCRRLGLTPPVPESMLGPMGTLDLPPGAPGAEALKARLYDRWRIQIPVWPGPAGGTALRISAQVYNTIGQYDHLADALAAEL